MPKRINSVIGAGKRPLVLKTFIREANKRFPIFVMGETFWRPPEGRKTNAHQRNISNRRRRLQLSVLTRPNSYMRNVMLKKNILEFKVSSSLRHEVSPFSMLFSKNRIYRVIHQQQFDCNISQVLETMSL